jgi:hypothetical protein
VVGIFSRTGHRDPQPPAQCQAIFPEQHHHGSGKSSSPDISRLM